jgi:putative ABC transport system permease protein
MNFWELIKVAFQALKANKTRALLTMMGIIIGVAAVILLVSIGSGLKTYIAKQLEGLGWSQVVVMAGELGLGEGHQGPPGAGMAASKLTLEHVQRIERKAETAKRVAGYTENSATMKFGQKTHTTQVAGTSWEHLEMRRESVKEGAFFTREEQERGKRVAVLGNTVAEELFATQDPIGKRITIADSPYRVLGVLEEKGAVAGIDIDDQVFIPVTTALRQFDMENLITIFVESRTPETVSQTVEEVEKILGEELEEDEFSVLEAKDLLSTVTSILGALTAALGGIAAISLVVGGIGIMNIMLVSVTERTHEIGLRKAVGATPTTIMAQFLIEAVILSVGGGLLGIFLGAAGSLVLHQFMPTSITFWSVATASLVSAAIGIFFGVGPATKAARLNPIDALRYE